MMVARSDAQVSVASNDKAVTSNVLNGLVMMLSSLQGIVRRPVVILLLPLSHKEALYPVHLRVETIKGQQR